MVARLISAVAAIAPAEVSAVAGEPGALKSLRANVAVNTILNSPLAVYGIQTHQGGMDVEGR